MLVSLSLSVYLLVAEAASFDKKSYAGAIHKARSYKKLLRQSAQKQNCTALLF
jgi:hypothetical protein